MRSRAPAQKRNLTLEELTRSAVTAQETVMLSGDSLADFDPYAGDAVAGVGGTTVKPFPAPPGENELFRPSPYRGYGLALDPIQNDLLAMGIKSDGEDAYNIHEIPNVDGKTRIVLRVGTTFLRSFLTLRRQ